ncbi:MAG: hypothetical protein DMF50_02135 [Acidobacteria bacterium]|nr:MAG: hypothetical protein DMF50_02135 [Acidobacteriota bacterium]
MRGSTKGRQGEGSRARPWARAAAALVLAVPLVQAACATGRSYRVGEREMRGENYDRAVLYLSRAVAGKPDSTRYKVALSRAKQKAAQDHFVKGQAYVHEFQQVV